MRPLRFVLFTLAASLAALSLEAQPPAPVRKTVGPFTPLTASRTRLVAGDPDRNGVGNQCDEIVKWQRRDVLVTRSRRLNTPTFREAGMSNLFGIGERVRRVRRWDIQSGQKYGKWTVLELDHSKNSVRFWRCRCDCGRESRVTSSRLGNGCSTECFYCATSIGLALNLAGQNYRGWYVIGLDHLEPRKGTRHGVRHIWKCQCRCGCIQMIATRELRNGKSVYCRQCLGSSQKKGGWNSIWHRLLNGAKTRNLDVNVTQEFLLGLLDSQGYKCALSGVPIAIAADLVSHGKGGTTASVDRIDSTKGYAEGNVQWVHKLVNQMKMDMPENEFRFFCQRVAGYYSRRGDAITANFIP